MSKRGKRKSAPAGRRRDQPARPGHKYELVERFECGIELRGTEVKSLREGKAQIGDAYAAIEDGEVWLRSAHIPPYAPAAARTTSPSGRASCSCTATRSSA